MKSRMVSQRGHELKGTHLLSSSLRPWSRANATDPIRQTKWFLQESIPVLKCSDGSTIWVPYKSNLIWPNQERGKRILLCNMTQFPVSRGHVGCISFLKHSQVVGCPFLAGLYIPLVLGLSAFHMAVKSLSKVGFELIHIFKRSF